MTRISSEEAPCRPNGTSFHSNWPSYNRKLVFHRYAARTRSWRQLLLARKSLAKKRDPRAPLSSASMCGSGSTAGRVIALRPR